VHPLLVLVLVVLAMVGLSLVWVLNADFA